MSNKKKVKVIDITDEQFRRDFLDATTPPIDKNLKEELRKRLKEEFIESFPKKKDEKKEEKPRLSGKTLEALNKTKAIWKEKLFKMIDKMTEEEVNEKLVINTDISEKVVGIIDNRQEVEDHLSTLCTMVRVISSMKIDKKFDLLKDEAIQSLIKPSANLLCETAKSMTKTLENKKQLLKDMVSKIIDSYKNVYNREFSFVPVDYEPCRDNKLELCDATEEDVDKVLEMTKGFYNEETEKQKSNKVLEKEPNKKLYRNLVNNFTLERINNFLSGESQIPEEAKIIMEEYKAKMKAKAKDRLHTQTCNQLRKLAKRFKIKNYSRMDKKTLIINLEKVV